MGMCKIAVLVSGTGQLLEAMIEQRVPISLVVADRRCHAIDVVARRAGLPNALVLRSQCYRDQMFARDYYTRHVTDLLQRHGIDVVVMAGFRTVFTPEIFGPYDGRILNIHPSLLPAFKGDHPVRDALAAGVKFTGTTVHVAAPEADCGRILAQEPVRVLEDDTEAALHERIKKVERELYPAIVCEFAYQS